MRSLVGLAHGRGHHESGPTNLIPNPKFIGNAANWIASPRVYDDVGATGTVGYDGTQSVDATGGALKVTGSGTEFLYFAAMLTTHIPVVPGLYYTFSGNVKTDTPLFAGAQLMLQLYESAAVDADDAIENAGAAIDNLGSPTRWIGDWSETVLTASMFAPAPVNASYGLVLCAVDWGETTAVDISVWFDNLTLLASEIAP